MFFMEKDKKHLIITEKDVLILKKLLEDGRKSSASISKEIDLGREIVNYRIKRLIKENLIVKFVPKLNETAMNYQEYIILLKLNLDDDVSKENFIRNSIGNKYLVWVVKSKSGWDLIVRLFAQSIEEFKLKLSEILENFSDVLAKYYTIISSDEIKESEKEILQKKLFEEEIVKKDFRIVKNRVLPQIDDKDKEILHILEEDARTQYKDIAQKLKISSDTVKYRIDKMKSQGVIEYFKPILNFNKLGFFHYAGILKFQYMDREDEEKLSKLLKRKDEIIRAIKNLNSEEFFLDLAFNKEKDVGDFKGEFERIFGKKLESFEMFKVD